MPPAEKKSILITGYFPVKGYKKGVEESYIRPFQENFLPGLLGLHKISKVYIYTDSVPLHDRLTEFVGQFSTEHSSNLPMTISVRLKCIAPEAAATEKYIARDCGRKSCRSRLIPGTAAKLLTVWSNKISLIHHTYLTEKDRDKNHYIWTDFQKSSFLCKKGERSPLLEMEMCDGFNGIYMPHQYGCLEGNKHSFEGKSPCQARYIANFIGVPCNFVEKLHRKYFNAVDKLSKVCKYFDEEIALTYAVNRGSLKIIPRVQQ